MQTLLFFLVALVAIILLVQAMRIITILKAMKATPKIPYNSEYKIVLPFEIPPTVQGAFAKISGVLQAHNLVKVTDFRIEGQGGYYSLYRDDNERMHVSILSSKEINSTFVIAVNITTYFTDGSMVLSANTPPYTLPSNIQPNETLRYFPDCMPDDLLRLHKEYIANQTPQLTKKELPENLLKFLEKESRESLDIKIKKGQLKRDKDEKYLEYSFLYHFSLVSQILDYKLKQQMGKSVKHPCLVTNLPYARGFAGWINPGSRQAWESHSAALGLRKKKWRWEFLVPIIMMIMIMMMMMFVLNNTQHKRDRSDYLKYRQEHYRKLYTFGRVKVSPLTESLEKIEKWWETYLQPTFRSLQPGLSREQVQQVLKNLPLTIPEELYTLYSWHNGQQGTGPGVEFIPAYSFLSLQDAVETYREMRKVSKKTGKEGNKIWPPYYFPILSFQDSFYVVLCGGEKPGSVLDLLLEDPEPGAAYPSISAFMQEIAENYDAGAYYVGNEGLLETDVDKIETVFKKYHPALPSKYSREKFSNTEKKKIGKTNPR